RDPAVREDGSIPLVDLLEETLAEMMEEGSLIDAVVARSDQQRRQMWERRESAAELTLGDGPIVDCDICVPVDKVETFLTEMEARFPALDAGAQALAVSHLGDGNVHYTLFATDRDPEHLDRLRDLVEEVVAELRGSFSAEHGIGLSKLN